ncbi:protein kinase family protein [Virgibacillus necropolis]|nr:hypothetical protein [Virgibacillus necropolis]
MTKASWGENWIKICTLLEIGIPLRPPQSVTGGLLHHMWRIDTKSGIFAVKVLNPEIMSRPDAKRNYRLSERIAQVAYSNGIHAVPVKMIGNEPWVEVDGKYIMVFDWVYGYTLLPEQCTFEHWSRNSDGTSNKKRFQAVIEAYLNNGGTLSGRVLDALYGSFGGMLGWLEYNMRRSLDKDVFTMEERELGHKEVLHTIRDLKKLNEAVSDYFQWIEDVS